MSDLCHCLQREKSWKQVWKENCIIWHQSKVFNCLLCFFPKFATTPLSSQQDNTRLYPFLLLKHLFQNLRNAVDRNWEIKLSESKKYIWQYGRHIHLSEFEKCSGQKLRNIVLRIKETHLITCEKYIHLSSGRDNTQLCFDLSQEQSYNLKSDVILTHWTI